MPSITAATDRRNKPAPDPDPGSGDDSEKRSVHPLAGIAPLSRGLASIDGSTSVILSNMGLTEVDPFGVASVGFTGDATTRFEGAVNVANGNGAVAYSGQGNADATVTLTGASRAGKESVVAFSGTDLS